MCDLEATGDPPALSSAISAFMTKRIEDRSFVGKEVSELIDHQVLEISCRYAPTVWLARSCAGDERPRNVISIARALLYGVARRQSLAGLVENEASKEAWRQSKDLRRAR